MPININELYLDTVSRVNPIQSGFFDDMFNPYVNQASRDLFDDLTGRRRQYQPGKFQAVTGGFQGNNKITDSLFPFIKVKVLSSDENGLIARPDDYAYFVNMRARYDNGALFECLCDSKNPVDCPDMPDNPAEPSLDEKIKKQLATVYPEADVEFIDFNEVSVRLNSAIYFPSNAYPIAYPLTVEADVVANNRSYFQMLPKNLGSPILTYLRQPKDAVYAFTEDPNTGESIFDPANSVNLEWDKKMTNEILDRICKYYSQFIDKNQLYETANNEIKQP